MVLKRKKPNLLEDGSPASTGHKPKSVSHHITTPIPRPQAEGNGRSHTKSPSNIINVDGKLRRQIETDREIEGYAYKIRQEVRRLSKLTEEISQAYSEYAESNERIDSSPSIHNGLGNMMKLIEVQTTTKLRIKKMQTAIMQAIAQNTPDDELPYAMQDIMREVNVNFLDSKLVRAYGEIARIMKEDLELAKAHSNEIQFAGGQLSSELEAMPTIDIKPEQRTVEDEEDYEQS